MDFAFNEALHYSYSLLNKKYKKRLDLFISKFKYVTEVETVLDILKIFFYKFVGPNYKNTIFRCSCELFNPHPSYINKENNFHKSEAEKNFKIIVSL